MRVNKVIRFKKRITTNRIMTTFVLQKECIDGGPITCVSFVPSSSTTTTTSSSSSSSSNCCCCCFYGQGPYLHQLVWSNGTNNRSSKSTSSTNIQEDVITNNIIIDGVTTQQQQQEQIKKEKLLVFPEGGTIHGIRYISTTTTTTNNNNNPSTVVIPNVVIVFGGRQISFVQYSSMYHHHHHHHPPRQQDDEVTTLTTTRNKLQTLKILPPMELYHQQQDDESKQQQQQQQQQNYPTVLTVSDWIWDCKCRVRRKKSIKTDNDDNTRYNNNKTTTTKKQEIEMYIGLAHNIIEYWILQIVQKKDVLNNNATTTTTTTTNFRIQLLSPKPIKIYQGLTRCILYCMDITFDTGYSTSSYSVQNDNDRYDDSTSCCSVAVGTVSNEILIWNLSSSTNNNNNNNNNNDDTSSNSSSQRTTIVNKFHTLRGHLGVIHAVKFFNNNNTNPTTNSSSAKQQCCKLVSTSDDRSVRVWVKQKQQQQQQLVNDDDTTNDIWVLQWTGWGHTARGWDIQFINLPVVYATNTTTTTNNNNNNNHPDDSTIISLVVSTGEDGTLRVWDYNKELSSSYYYYDQRNKSNNSIEDRNNNDSITNENTTTTTTTITKSDLIATIRGHSCQCIWNVDSLQDLVVTSGNDGTVAFYNIWDRIIIKMKEKFQPLVDNTAVVPSQDAVSNSIRCLDHLRRVPSSWECSIPIPDDRVHHNRVDSVRIGVESEQQQQFTTTTTTTKDEAVVTTRKTKKQKQQRQNNNQPSPQIIVGMKFFNIHRREESSTDPTIGILVATRDGSIMYFNLTTQRWVHCLSWLPPEEESTNVQSTNVQGEQLANHPEEEIFVTVSNDKNTPHKKLQSVGCCMTVHASRPLVTIGTINGDIILQPIIEKQDENTNGTRMILLLSEGRSKRAVQRLAWLSDTVLLSFHAKGCLLWSIEFDDSTVCCSSITKISSHVNPVVLESDTNGMGISYAYNEKSSLLAIGDTRGNVSLYTLQQFIAPGYTTTSLAPMFVLSRAHRKEHVTDLIWKDESRLISVGNDGCILESKFYTDDASCTTTKLDKMIAVPIGACTGLSNVWMPNTKNPSRIIVGGYYGNRFAIVDAANGYEFTSIDTGGRQRSLDIYIASVTNVTKSAFPFGSGIAVCANLKDGTNEILLQMGGQPANPSQQSLSLSPPIHSVGHCLHGETIFDICWIPLDLSLGSIGLLTGSEDCTARISIYNNDTTCIATKQLPPQVSGIRAVCYSCFNTDTRATLIAIGGKLTIDCFLVSSNESTTNGDVDIQYIRSSKSNEKVSIDHRMNAIKAVPLTNGITDITGHIHLIATGDSNGSCYLHFVSEHPQERFRDVQLLYRHQRPILSLEIVQCGSRYLLLLGTTAGDILFFDIPSSTDTMLWDDLKAQPILQYQAHSMGTNALSAITLKESMIEPNTMIIRVCSGGDDQAVSCIEVLITIDDKGCISGANIVRKTMRQNCGISAMKGVKWVKNDMLIATGYDQQLSLWKWTDAYLNKNGKIAIDIGDVNCLSHHALSSDKHVIAVAGAGIEVLSLIL